MTVGLLDGAQVVDDFSCLDFRAGGEQAARRLDQVARPDEVVAAQVFVAFGEPPWYRQTRDVAACKGACLVCAQHRCAHAIGVGALGRYVGVEGHQRILPRAPPRDVFGERVVDALAQARAHAKRCFGRGAPETQREDETAAARLQVHFPGERDVTVARDVVTPTQLEMPGQILPAVRKSHVTDAAREERRRAADCERRAAAFGEQHRRALVLVDPGRIASSAVDEVWGKQCIQMVLAQGSA